MRPSPIKNVVILGGGTAGWLSAAYLNRALGAEISITLVESPELRSVGVGEATVPTFQHTMRFLGFEESEWMPQCDATWKLGIRHIGWAGSEGRPYFLHPFFEFPEPRHLPTLAPWFGGAGQGLTLAQCWQTARTEGWIDDPFVDFVVPNEALCQAGGSPLSKDGTPLAGLRYAHHIDADRLVTLLRETSCSRGVKHLRDHVTGVERGAQGELIALKTRTGASVHGDLFLDCSGFRSMLLGGELKEPFESLDHQFFVDRALATRCSLRGEEPAPYTSAYAASSGWIWETPLRSRAGQGYTFSQRHQSEDEAAAEFLDHLGGRGNEADLRLLTLRPGRHRRSWVENCVAIGLASSFIEPLESTSILLIEYQLATLLNQFPQNAHDTVRRDQFNRTVASVFDSVRDFVLAHYLLSGRRDTPFWAEVTALDPPESLSRRLQELKQGVFRPDSSLASATIFATRNYMALLDGLNFPFEASSPTVTHLASKSWILDTLEKARARHSGVAQAVLSHGEALRLQQRDRQESGD